MTGRRSAAAPGEGEQALIILCPADQGRGRNNGTRLRRGDVGEMANKKQSGETGLGSEKGSLQGPPTATPPQSRVTSHLEHQQSYGISFLNVQSLLTD